MTQSITNLQSEEAHIKSLTGLPAAAAKVQQESGALVSGIVTQMQTAQHAATSFVAQAKAAIDKADQQLGGDAKLADVEATLAPIQQAAKTLASDIDAANGAVVKAQTTLTGYANELASVESQLATQKASLVAKMNAAKDEASAQNKKRWAWLALGPFGIAGAAAALALFIKASNEASALEAQSNALAAQINRQNALVAATRQLAGDFTTLAGRLASLRNASDIVNADLGEVMQDLDESAQRTVVTLKVKGAETEVQTLAADAA